MTAQSAMVEYFAQYSDNMWWIALPSVAREYKRRSALPEGHPDRTQGLERPRGVVQNEMLSRASKAIVGLRPGLYFKWVTSAQVYGLKQLANYMWIIAPTGLLMLSVPLFLIANRPAAGSMLPIEPGVLSTLIGLVLLGAGYFAAYLLLVSLVSFPFVRYFVSLTLFLPSAICAQLWVMWSRILPSRA
jgi:hypothetical protein